MLPITRCSIPWSFRIVCASSRTETLRYSMPSLRLMDIESTFVPSAARGRGVGAALVERALEHARNEGYQVIPSCWYVKRWVERHPDYAGLLRDSPSTGRLRT
jgi:hypothetical protein